MHQSQTAAVERHVRRQPLPLQEDAAHTRTGESPGYFHSATGEEAGSEGRNLFEFKLK